MTDKEIKRLTDIFEATGTLVSSRDGRHLTPENQTTIIAALIQRDSLIEAAKIQQAGAIEAAKIMEKGLDHIGRNV